MAYHKALIRIATNLTKVRTDENVWCYSYTNLFEKVFNFHAENVAGIPILMVINIKLYGLNSKLV
jgi:hypothetical protein